MLQFKDSGYWQDLHQWHFRWMTSAWRNRLHENGVQNTTQLAGGTLEFLWCAAPGQRGSLGGTPSDNKLSHIYINPAGTIC